MTFAISSPPSAYTFGASPVILNRPLSVEIIKKMTEAAERSQTRAATDTLYHGFISTYDDQICSFFMKQAEAMQHFFLQKDLGIAPQLFSERVNVCFGINKYSTATIVICEKEKTVCIDTRPSLSLEETVARIYEWTFLMRIHTYCSTFRDITRAQRVLDSFRGGIILKLIALPNEETDKPFEGQPWTTTTF